jgi:hypothetical protein
MRLVSERETDIFQANQNVISTAGGDRFFLIVFAIMSMYVAS